ncbi:MAG: ATP-binding protein [Proteobacteria bacterium]|nr:ATP-binding protein [Pseudomonadota bacterium]
MKRQIAFAASSLVIVLITACSSVPSAPTANSPAQAKAGVLVTPEGEKLYVFKKDPAGKSSCVRDCLKPYRPLFSTPDDKSVGDYTSIERPDGMSQWAYKGKALYTCPVSKVPAGAPEKVVKAAEKKAADCAKGLQGDWDIAKS